MNFFDIVVIGIIAFCLVRGVFRGFVREIASIAGVAAGFYGASTYHAVAGAFFTPWIDAEMGRNLLGFFLIFTAIIVVVGIVAALIRYVLKIAFLGWMDRFCGMVFGSAKGILICVVIFIMITTFLPARSAWLADSRLSPWLAEASRWVTLVVADDVKNSFQVKMEGMKKFWEKQNVGVKTKI